MAAATITFPTGSMNRLTALVVSDGTSATAPITQAALLAALQALKVPNPTTGALLRLAPSTGHPGVTPTPPIVSALTATYATQAAARAATIEGPVKMTVRTRSGAAPAAVANAAPIAVDVDVDGGLKLVVNLALPTTACTFYLDMLDAFSASDGPNCAP